MARSRRTPEIEYLMALGFFGGGGAAFTYLFRDEFTTDVSPLPNPSTGEPGPGDWTVSNSTGFMSKAGGNLVVNGTAPAIGGICSPLFAKAPGLAAIWQSVVVTAHGYCRIGIHNAIASNPSPLMQIEPNHAVDSVFLSSPSAGTTGYAMVLLQTKTAVFTQRGGAWILEWVSNNYPVPASVGAMWWFSQFFTTTISVDTATVRVLPAPFITDSGIATLNVASPVDTTEYTGDADGIIDLTVTAPGTLDGSASTRCGFYYRADSDLSPAWHCYVDGTGAFNLDSIDAAGTRTNRITAASVIAGGATVTLRVIAAGTKHNAYTLSGTTWTKRGGEITLSLNDAVTRIIPSVPAGWTAANQLSFARTSSAYETELNRGN